MVKKEKILIQINKYMEKPEIVLGSNAEAAYHDIVDYLLKNPGFHHSKKLIQFVKGLRNNCLTSADIRKIISLARINGHPITSTVADGYSYANNMDQMIPYLEHNRSRYEKMLYAQKACVRRFENNEQFNLFGE